ncbi:MAG: BON domain-containing protein [Acidobacteriota bacterium]|nr:BON domain-containing protein [Acidobacteriota bacterium]
MKKCGVRIFFLFAIIIVSISSVSAWDDTGHKLTAYIAWEQMTPQAREAAVKILLSAPEDSDLSVFYLQDSRSAAAKQRELFMIAATWADIVRDKNFKNRNAKYHHGTWHYLDTFWRDENGKVELVTDLQPDKENAVERLFTFDKTLRDASIPDADKAIALAWILHVGGDIHQPLHDSSRVTKYDPKGDQGGNLFMLSPKGATGEDRLSLHWYWDSIIGRNIPRNNDACDSDYLPPIAQTIMKNYPISKMQNRLEIGQFDKWQQEGFQIASTKLYPSSLRFNQMPPESYKKMAFEIAQEQIALAGYRLGAMLNQVLGSQGLTREAYENNKARYVLEQAKSIIGQGVDDKWIWFKSRTALATTNDLRESTINVAVENSVVTLSGTVANKAQKQKAAMVVKGIDGVKQVRNILKISPNKKII